MPTTIEKLVTKLSSGVIYPIPPAFSGENFDKFGVIKYLDFLFNNNCKTVLTTAGTSKYNLMNDDEVIELYEAIMAFGGLKILGLLPMSLKHTLGYLNITNQLQPDAILALYPDRYYDDQSIVDYFHRIADQSIVPVMFHGMFMRHGRGGTYEYQPGLVCKIKKHDNIIGMKEESINLHLAYKIARCADDNFLVFPAGGSCRRYLLTGPAGAQTFLGGIGNIFPQIENAFFDAYKQQNMPVMQKIVNNYETPLFNAFEKIGWHKALQIALNLKKLLVTDNRAPFSVSTSIEVDIVREVLNDIEARLPI